MAIYFFVIVGIFTLSLTVWSIIYFSKAETNLFEDEIKKKFRTSQLNVTMYDEVMKVSWGPYVSPRIQVSKVFVRKAKIFNDKGKSKIYLVRINCNLFFGSEIIETKLLDSIEL